MSGEKCLLLRVEVLKRYVSYVRILLYPKVSNSKYGGYKEVLGFEFNVSSLFSKSVLDIRTRLVVTVEPETK